MFFEKILFEYVFWSTLEKDERREGVFDQEMQ